MAIVTACAVLSLIAGMAYRGQTWAWGVTIGVASLGLTALVHAAMFGGVWLFAQLFPDRTPTLDRRGDTPMPILLQGDGGPDGARSEHPDRGDDSP